MADVVRTHAPLCLILLSYVRPLDELDAQMPAHVAWLEQNFAQGLFVLAGRQVPRTGGVIVARGHAAEVAALAASDPFVTSGVATVEVVAFTGSFVHPLLGELLA